MNTKVTERCISIPPESEGGDEASDGTEMKNYRIKGTVD